MNEFLEANWTSLAGLGVIVLLFLLLRNRATRVSGGLEEILGKGQPVIVEVFSNT
jgi:hypothetical protein